MQTQHFSVNDGEGIRTTLFLAGCPLRCAWCANPEGQTCQNPMTRWAETEEVLRALEGQRIFYRFSGGGVTFSGGEATMQGDFLKELTDALRFDKRGYIFVEKWQYLNSDRETRCLDCIVWTNDMSIAYIRFYSDNAQQLSGTEMNAGLDRLDKYSSEFYPYLSDQYYTLMQMKDELRQTAYERPEGADETEWAVMIDDFVGTIRVDHFGDYNSILRCIVAKYDAYRENIYDNCGKSENPLIPYWLAHYGFEDVFTSQGYAVVGGCKVCDLFLNQYGVWIKPSYSAKDGIIYQTLTAGTNEITVIYNVRDDMIEGFYFPRCSDDSYYISYEENGVG